MYDTGHTRYRDLPGSLLWHVTILHELSFSIYIGHCVNNKVDYAKEKHDILTLWQLSFLNKDISNNKFTH
jgi:hypothetical protein